MAQYRAVLVAVVVRFVVEISAIHADPGASWWDRHVESISCVRPGYFVNPVDCHSFYRCVDRSTWNKPALQRYDFTCPNGMVFDVAFSVCTRPGANGCADPWWPRTGENSGKSRPGPNDPPLGEGANSLERAPSLFDGSQERGRPSGERGGGGISSPFGGSSSNDPLDADFGSPSIESSTKPGAEASFGLFNGGSGSSFGGDPLDTDFGTSTGKPGTQPGDNSNIPSFLNRSPGGRPASGGLSGSNNGGIGRDPLDADFGSSPDNSDTTPASRPGSAGLFGSNNNGGRSRDPLDADFGSSTDNPGAGFGGRPGSESRGPFGGNNRLGEDPLDSDFGSPTGNYGSREGGSSGEKDNKPGRFQDAGANKRDPSKGSSESWWGSNSNDRKNEGSLNSLEFDNWNNSPDQNSNKPNSANWGGSSPPPTLDTSPWTPTGPPWGLGSSNDFGSGSSSSSIPESPPRPSPPSDSPSRPHNRPSWWDPPYAYPYRPPGISTVSPRPSNPNLAPDPWLYHYRPKYPTYQIVAYPTWPPPPPRGPYSHRPILVVYSNSKK